MITAVVLLAVNRNWKLFSPSESRDSSTLPSRTGFGSALICQNGHMPEPVSEINLEQLF